MMLPGAACYELKDRRGSGPGGGKGVGKGESAKSTQQSHNVRRGGV